MARVTPSSGVAPCSRCGHAAKHFDPLTGRLRRLCDGYHQSGGIIGAMQRCNCPTYDPTPLPPRKETPA